MNQLDMSKAYTLPKIDRSQNFYHLASIQIVGQSIPSVMVGKLLFEQYGAGTTVNSIIIGNLILWLIGLAIISMVYQAHTNAIENISGYLGKYGGLTFALSLIIAFLIWYVNQINISIISLKSILQFRNYWKDGFDIRIGAVLGLLSAVLSIGGIRLLKWLTVIAFPFLFCYYAYAVIVSQESPVFEGSWGLSLPAVVSVVLLNLPGTINLPTFFRHSKSKANSFLALTIMTVFTILFECATIWMDFSGAIEFSDVNTPTPLVTMLILPFVSFLIITSVCSNLINIYLASACYESFIPKFSGTKGHAIMGLIGTAAYTFIQISSPINFLINLLNAYIGIMGIILLIAVMARLIIKHRPRKYEKVINCASWLFGCVVSTYLEVKQPDAAIHSLFFGMSASVLFFLVVFFIEETYWSIQKISLEERKPLKDNEA